MLMGAKPTTQTVLSHLCTLLLLVNTKAMRQPEPSGQLGWRCECGIMGRRERGGVL